MAARGPCQTKGWSRRPQAACSSLFGRFAPCRRPPRAVGASTNAKRQRKARPRALWGLAGETMAGRAAAPAPPLRAKPLPCGQRRHTPAQAKSGSQKPPSDCRVCARQYCAEIDEAARNRMELIVPELAKRNGVPEQLKADNQLEWVRQMNACKAQAEAIVKFELSYD